MITSKNDILSLLNEYLDMQQELNAQLWTEDAEKWSGRRQAFYGSGVVLGKFREKDAFTLQTLRQGVSDEALYDEIRQSYERVIKEQMKIEHPDILQQEELKINKKQLAALRECPLDEWIESSCRWINEEAASLDDSGKKALLYLYYAFDNYASVLKNRYYSDVSRLTETYGGVFDKQSQFCKYGLVPLDADRMLLPIEPPRIYDSSVDKTFFTKNIPLCLLKKLSDMMSEGMIGDLAVRLLDEPGYKGKLSCEYIAEELERGELFELTSLGRYAVNKLYSAQYEDCLWVVIDAENVTFEEMCKDFDDFEEMIVTQVMHLQYKNVAGKSYITHLDHEYVFYTAEEYIDRINDVTQKGTAKQRMKSFKLDHAKIPFDFAFELFRKDEDGRELPVVKEQFLCYVLECYFKHKDLLKEYFQKVAP